MRFPAVVALSIALALGAVSCGKSKRVAASSGGHKRMIVLGIDGMDPKFLEAHWDVLPNLAKLKGEGEFKRLATTIPPQSPVAWSTFITGMDPGGHGIYDFIHRNPETAMPFSSMAETSEPTKTLSLGPYILPLSQGKVTALRKGKAFWQILSEHGVPVNILRMPTNFPPVECEGESLSGMGTPDMRGTFSTFTFFTDQEGEKGRTVPGGQIISVKLKDHRAVLGVPGPTNTLRKDRQQTIKDITVDVDPAAAVARFQVDGQTLVLKQGEWSGWLKTQFDLIPHVKGAAGMFRIYAKQLKPGFQIYVSPINIDPEQPELPIAEPADYSKTLAKAVGPFFTQGMAEDTAALRQNVFTRPEYLSQARLVSQEHLKLLRYGVENFKEGLLFFHFFGVDQNSHMLWGKFNDDLLETYKLVDQALGWTMEHAKNASVVVMSDHGFSTFDRAVHLNSWLMKEGFLKLDNPANVGADELFAHVDWTGTQAYALGLNGLYLNLSGRERNGSVDPMESRFVLNKLKERLLQFKDPDTGKQVVDTVYFSRDQFHGAMVDTAPDILVGYGQGFRGSWQTALGAVPKVTVEDNTEAWIGDHCIASHHVPGVLLSNRKSKVSDPALADLPATILSEFGVSPAEGMVGRVIY